jgi:LemA protein
MQDDGATFSQATDLYDRLTRAANFALDHWWLWLVLGRIVIVALKVRAQRALIASLDDRADAAFGDVDALLIERSSLIGNPVEVVRAFSQREHDVIRDVLDARVDALQAASDAAIQTGTQIADVLQNVFSVSEQ